MFQQQQHQKLPYTIIAQQLSTTPAPTTLLIDSTILPCSHQQITITMASLASDDNYVQMTINALTEFRKKLNLAPKHNIVPSDLEPPVWNVEKQVGIIPRTGKEVSKRMNDVSKLNLLPTHYRLFPKHFMSRKPPFVSEQNERVVGACFRNFSLSITNSRSHYKIKLKRNVVRL